MSVFSLAACLIWGAAATYCFFEAWMAFVCLAACVIGLLRGKREALALVGFAYHRSLLLLVFGLGLVLLFALFWGKFGFGKTPAETLAFLVPATAVMLKMGRRLSARLDEIWQRTNENP